MSLPPEMISLCDQIHSETRAMLDMYLDATRKSMETHRKKGLDMDEAQGVGTLSMVTAELFESAPATASSMLALLLHRAAVADMEKKDA